MPAGIKAATEGKRLVPKRTGDDWGDPAMGTLSTATFTLSLEGADDDLLEAIAAAFIHALHGAGLTPRDAMSAWATLDAWERAGSPRDADPGSAWRSKMAISAQALRLASAKAVRGGCTQGFRISGSVSSLT
jgi:hypothetical protein